MIIDLLRGFWRHRAGTVSIIGALALPLLLGFVSLVGEFGYGLVVKVENQRTADLASYAGALAYSSTNSTTTMTSVAQNVAALNGIGASQTTVGLVTSPRTAADKAVAVNVQRNDILLLAPILGSGSTLPVASQADAQVAAPPSASACILALSGGGSGVTLSGGTSISASNCAVASDATGSSFTAPCGTSISALSLAYNGTTPSPCNGNLPTKLVKSSTSDPVASNTTTETTVSNLQTAASGLSLTAPSAPTVPSVPSGTSVSFGYSGAPALPSGCSAALSGSTWTMTCASGKTYNFGAVSLGGGQNLTIVTTGSSATIFNFSSAFSFGGTVCVNVPPSTNANCPNTTPITAPITYNFGQGVTLSYGAMIFGSGSFNITNAISNGGGGTMSFGAGTFNVVQGISNSGTSLTFGVGTFNIGSGSCSSGGGNFSLCNSGGSTLTFGGPSTFVLTAGLYNAGGATMTLGSGSSNSFNIGPSSSGYAILAAGSAITTLGDATSSGDIFQVDGNIATQGGSCLTLSAASVHDIDGYISTQAGLVLGAGVYLIDDYLAVGATSGGNATCNVNGVSTTVGVLGTGVTLVTAGESTISAGACTNAAFCAGSGFGNVSLSAPTSGTDANLVLIGPPSNSSHPTATVNFNEGSGITLAGLLYFPDGSMALSGGAAVANQSGQCLQIVASQISLSGGTKLTDSYASGACFTSSGSSSSGSSTVELVQ